MKMITPRSTEQEKESRVSVVFDLLMQGMTQAQIVRHIRENADWGVSDRQVRNYVKDAQDLQAAEVRQIDRTALLYSVYERYEKLYARAEAEGDERMMMNALDRIVALWHLNVADAIIADWREQLTRSGANPDDVKEKIIHLLEARTNDK